ncbi:hypothetical protein PSPO01_08195 [Paraphaeosphaeria sporulosa]
MASSIPLGITVPTLHDVERCRKDTAELFRRLVLQRQLGRHYETRLKLNSKFEKMVQQYAWLSCQQLCHQVITSFPREVRDMVYSAMLDRGHAFKNVIQLSQAAHERHLGPLSANAAAFPPLICKLGMNETKYRHCWVVKYCGEVFLKELAEMCYREKTFVFGQEDLYLLPMFLGQRLSSPENTSQNAVAPLQQVGRLRLCLRPTGNGWRFTLKTLRFLLKLQRKATIEVILDVNLVIKSGKCDIDRVITIYRPLFPLFASVKSRGHIVSFRYGSMSLGGKVGMSTIPDAVAMRTKWEWADFAQQKLTDVSPRPMIFVVTHILIVLEAFISVEPPKSNKQKRTPSRRDGS